MTEDFWYKNAVIYSLDLETFMDGNNDGTGDFEGLMARLDYLHALGLDCIWLAPFQPTPNKDNGYDVSDYYGVDPRHGCAGDFVNFIHKAHKLGIKVIIDLVVNHTSDQHPWFKESRSSKDNPKRDWYVWADKRPSDWNQGMVFPGVQKSTWTYDKQSRSYYFHRFHDYQPDLNTNNPEVRKEIEKIIAYWVQLGVSGFRVDAVPFILETPAPGAKKPQIQFEYLREIRRFLQWHRGDAVLLGEANVLPRDSIRYFGEEGEGIHLMFNFYVNQYAFHALATSKTHKLAKALEATRLDFPGSQWAQFLRNHDELDLGRLTERERQQVFDSFGPEPHMQIYDRGIRRRLSPMLGSRQRTELAYSLMFSLPGTPVIRYGDEIGMGDDLSLPERDSVRTPMQWSGEKQGGFSQAKKLDKPAISEGYYSYTHVNVENQRRDPTSIFNWMTSLIRLRKECAEIGLGEWQIIDTGQNEVLCIRYDWKDRTLFVWHNFEDKPREIDFVLKGSPPTVLVDLMKNIESVADKKGLHTISLDALGYRWFRLARR